MSKIKVDGPTYRKKILELAEVYMFIYPCNKCGSPVNQGYICYFCGNTDPVEPVW